MATQWPQFLVDRLWPEPATDLDLDDAFADLDLPRSRDAGRPLVTLNMVTSVDGRAQLQGTADGLAGRADRRLMRLLRAGHDAVGSGSGTLRAAGLWTWLPDDLAGRRELQGLPPQPLAVLFAGLRPIDPEAAWLRSEQPRLIFMGPATAAVQEPLPGGTELLVAPSDPPDPAWALERLVERSVASLVLEGGPRINAAFLAADAIDEIRWTIGAKLLGDESLPMITPIAAGSPWAEAPREGRLVSVHRHRDELFLHYRFV